MDNQQKINENQKKLPKLIKDLLSQKIDPNFKKNIRKYNNALAMASIGISEEIVQKGFSPNVKIHGQIYHLHGSLFPEGNEKPKFAQICVYDGNLEKEAMYLSQLKRRMEVYGGEKNTKAEYENAKAQLEVNKNTMAKLQEVLHTSNSYYLTYKAIAKIDPKKIANKKIVLNNEKPQDSKDHKRQWNLPQACEVAFIDMSADSTRPVDIIIQLHGGGPQRISERNRSFQPLHYVLLFPFGDDGWHFNLHKTKPNGEKMTGTKGKISPNMFHRHRMMDRDGPEHAEFNSVIRGGRLFQEWCCGMHYVAERMKLSWVEQNQKSIKAEKYQGLLDAITEKDDMKDIGFKTILPPSHQGSPRWYTEKFQGKCFHTY